MGAVLVAKSREIIGEGSSFDPNKAILAAVDQSGFKITGSSENLFQEVVKSSETEELEKQLSGATLYVTLEPDHPGTTDMVRQAGIGRIVIGTANAITNGAELMAKTLETAGYDVILGKILKEECDELIRSYTEHNFDRMTMAYFENCGRPLGVLHCSVIDSENIKSFSDKGNSFLKLSFTDCDTFQIAPPPDEMNDASPWQVRIYEHANAIVVTFPRKGNGSAVDDSIQNRLEGLKWLATHASFLPKEAQRILVVDAADLRHIPLSNDNPNTPKNVDIDAFWQSGCRILLRRVQNEYAQASAQAAAEAATKAAESAAIIAEAIDFPETAKTAELAVEYQKSAQTYTENLGKMLKEAEDLRAQFKKLGVKIEFVDGGDPIDVMRHLGTQFKSVVWRAGFWGEKGAKAIYGGAFQVVSAHVAVATADCLHELDRAKNTVQAACGKPSSVQILADEEDMSLQHELGTAHVDGRPVRHVRVDCGLCFPKTQEDSPPAPTEDATS